MYVVVVVFVIHVSNGGGVSRYIVRRIGGVCCRGSGDYGRGSVVAAAAALMTAAVVATSSAALVSVVIT